MEWDTVEKKTNRRRDLERKCIPLYLSSPRGGWGRGLKRLDDRPEDAEVGKFSRGQERAGHGDADLQETKPRFSRGQEDMSNERDEKEREGRFSSGQEQREEL